MKSRINQLFDFMYICRIILYVDTDNITAIHINNHVL